jgi:hypothetical protein
MLWNTLFIYFFFWLLFSLVGLFIFYSTFARRCVVYEDGEPAGQWDGQYITAFLTRYTLTKRKRYSYHYLNTAYTVVEPESFCSGYYEKNPEDGSISSRGVYDIQVGKFVDQSGGLLCQVGQYCIQDPVLTPQWGYLSYSNIYYSMVNVFTVISIEDWSYMMYDSQDGLSTAWVPIFYCLCVYFMTFIIVPLFIGKWAFSIFLFHRLFV